MKNFVLAVRLGVEEAADLGSVGVVATEGTRRPLVHMLQATVGAEHVTALEITFLKESNYECWV